MTNNKKSNIIIQIYFPLLTPSVLVANVGESPDVSQVDGKPDDREQELDLFVPRLPGGQVRVVGDAAGRVGGQQGHAGGRRALVVVSGGGVRGGSRGGGQQALAGRHLAIRRALATSAALVLLPGGEGRELHGRLQRT